MPVLFLTTFEVVTVERFGQTEEGAVTGPFYENIRRPVGVDGIGDWQSIDLGRSDGCVVYAFDGAVAPAGTVEFDHTNIVTRQDSNVLRSRFGLSVGDARALEGLTWGQAFFELVGVGLVARDGRRRLRVGPLVLDDRAG